MALQKDKIRAAALKFLQRGHLDKAVRELERLVEMDPHDMRTLLKIGDLQERMGLGEQATDTYGEVADFYEAQGFFLKASAVYKQILRMQPDHLRAGSKLAELYHKLGLRRDAWREYQRLSNLLQVRGDARGRISVLERLLQLEPDDVGCRIQWANGLLRMGQHERAVKGLSAAAARSQERGDSEGFVELMECLIRISGRRDHSWLRQLGRVQLELREFEKAVANLETCREIESNDEHVLALLADAYEELGESRLACEILWKRVELRRAAGDMAEERNILEKILHLNPEDPQAQQALADAASQSSTDLRVDALPEAESMDLSDVESSELPVPVAHTRVGRTTPPPPPIELGYIPSDLASEIDLDDEPQGTASGRDGYQTLDNINVAEPSEWVMRAIDDAPGAMPPVTVDEEFDIDIEFDLDDDDGETGPSELGAQFSSGDGPTILVPPPPPVSAPAVIAPPPPPSSPEVKVVAPPPPLMDVAPPVAAPAPPTVGTTSGPPLTTDIDEIRFLISHDLVEEAQASFETLHGQYPEHSGLQGLLTDFPEVLRPSPTGSLKVPEESVPPRGDTDSVLEDLLTPSASKVFDPLKTSELPPLLGLNEVAKLRQHLPEEIPAHDYETHYNLGIAYKEMGMLDDGVRELTLAAESPTFEIPALTIIGQCKLELGQCAEALANFFKALNARNIKASEQISLHYEIAEAYHAMGVITEALAYYEKVLGTAPGYRDVDKKVATLREAAAEGNTNAPKTDKVSYI
ncbi:MAG: hypothetical protein VX834_12885 [Myxococcota bacterium]|nr:hypothetical protein [Myxococcota bacterium]